MKRNTVVYAMLFLVTGILVLVAVASSDDPPIGTAGEEEPRATEAVREVPDEMAADESTATGAEDAMTATADDPAERLRQHRENVERLREMGRQGIESELEQIGPIAEGDHDDHDHSHEESPPPGAGQITYLAFDPPVLDLGEMMKGELRPTSVRITNVSEESVTLTRAIPTCVCTVPSMRVTNLNPGESMDVALEFDAKREGKQEVQIRFMMADNKGSQYLRVAADVKPVVSIEPATFEVQTAQDLLVTIRTTDRQPFRILSAVPEVIVGVEPEAALEHTVILSAAQWNGLSRKPSFVRIYTNHPKAPSLILRVARSQEVANVSRLFNWAGGMGEIDELEVLVQSGVSVEAADARGMTALMLAAAAGESERAGLIIREGAHPDVERNDGRTALMFAGAAGHAETVATLIELGANVNQADRFGRTALMWAARSGNAECLRLLLDEGAQVAVVGPSDETPLMYAVKSRDPERVRLLLEAGAARDAVDARGRTALDQAVELQRNLRDQNQTAMQEIVRLLRAE